MKTASLLLVAVLACANSVAAGDDLAVYFHQEGPLAGSLKSDAPLPVYDADPKHLWNRLFSAFYIRPRTLPATDERPAMTRFEGGDAIEFLAWGSTTYWSSEAVSRKVTLLLDEFLENGGERLIRTPLKRAVFQHDLWAVYDHLIGKNIHRSGDLTTRKRRDKLCRKLARCIQLLSLTQAELKSIPNTYELAIRSGDIVPDHNYDAARNYLPFGLLKDRDEWVEVDFYYPKMHEDIMDRFISLHARSLQGRSHYRIFYRFPGGRPAVLDYLKMLEEKGVRWKRAAQFGFIPPPEDVPQIPIGTEVVLLQLMMSMDEQLRPVPTSLVESVQLRVFRNVDGSSEPKTNTGAGINILDYRMKRLLLFDKFQAGGLHREPEEERQYRVAIDGLKPKAPDWGFADKTVLFQQCVDCHMSPRHTRLGVASIPSLTHSGGFDAGAMMGISRPVAADQTAARSKRVARFKSRHESYRRMLEHLGL